MSNPVLEKVEGISDKVGEICLAQNTHKEKIEAYEKSIESLTVKLDSSQKRITEMEEHIRRIMNNQYGPNKPVPKDQWSWCRFAFARATGNWDVAPFERDQIKAFKDEMRQKADMLGSDFATGGALIPTQYVNELIGLLRPRLMTEALGVTTLTGLTGSPVSWPKITGGSTAFWIAPETTAITSSGLSTGSLELAPRKCAVLVKVSNDLVLLSNPSVEATVRADMVQTLRQAIDLAFFRGLGSNGQPKGMLNQGIPTAGAATAFTAAADDEAALNAIKGMIKTVAQADALDGNLAFATNVESWFQFDALSDANARPYLQYEPAVAQVGGILAGTISGFPVRAGTNVATTGGPAAGDDMTYFGNWADALLAIWSAMEITSSTEADTAFASDELWIRAIIRVDVGVRRTASFSKMYTSAQS
jgi:HK97 family phage major capsid protein